MKAVLDKLNAALTRMGNALRYVLPLDNNARLMLILALFVALFLLGMALHKRVWGAELQIQASSGAAVLRGVAPAMNVAWDLPTGRGGDALRTSMTLIGHSSFRGTEYPNNYAFSVQYVTGFGHFDIGLGPAWMERPFPYNGSSVNFNLTTAYRFFIVPITLWYDHFSCGGSCTPNYGRDLVMLGYRF